MALALTALLSTMALVVDVGMAYQERRQLQTAVDAAALAGAMDLAEGRGEAAARTTVTSYVESNGNVPATVEVAFPDGASVRAGAVTNRSTFFARLFGQDRVAVKATAAARYGPASQVNNLVPIIVPYQAVAGHVGMDRQATFELGSDRPTSGKGQLGYFWLTDFNAGSGGVPDYADWIVNGYPEAVGVGSTANGEGVKASLREAMAERMAQDAKVVLPLYDYTEGGGSPGTYHVVGFAELVITGFDFNGQPKTITGYFTNGTVTPGGGGQAPPVDFGVDVVWLSE